MATKVKGDAIKEGSIPLSALSNEVKDKIKNAGGGADWNAQEGEAGYIENKPFGIKYCPWDSNDGEYSISGNKLMVTYPWFTSIMFKEPKFDYGLCVFDKDGNDYSETISDYDIAIFFDVTYVQSTHTLTIECSEGNIEDFIDCIKPTYVNHIEIDYIDSVIKTTPQTLSNTDKNQALANLGIDPVVLKYMLNNIIIQENDILGSEYKDILLVSNGEPVCIKFPYNNLIKVVTDKGTFNAIPDTTYSNLYPLYFITPDGTYNIISNEGQIYFEMRV